MTRTRGASDDTTRGVITACRPQITQGTVDVAFRRDPGRVIASISRMTAVSLGALAAAAPARALARALARASALALTAALVLALAAAPARALALVLAAPPAPALAAVPAVAPPAFSAAAPGPDPGVWPLRPRTTVLRGFQAPAFRYAPGHRGADLPAAAGQKVFAVRAGRVSFAGSVAGRRVISIEHGSTRTTYLPVRATVRTGAQVSAGTPVGVVEDGTGHCPVICLHWGLRRGADHLDPVPRGGGPVRLLPWWPTGRTTGGPGRAAPGERPAAEHGAEVPRTEQDPGMGPTARTGAVTPATSAAAVVIGLLAVLALGRVLRRRAGRTGTGRTGRARAVRRGDAPDGGPT